MYRIDKTSSLGHQKLAKTPRKMLEAFWIGLNYSEVKTIGVGLKNLRMLKKRLEASQMFLNYQGRC